jgi:hypothetical protein
MLEMEKGYHPKIEETIRKISEMDWRTHSILRREETVLRVSLLTISGYFMKTYRHVA